MVECAIVAEIAARFAQRPYGLRQPPGTPRIGVPGARAQCPASA